MWAKQSTAATLIVGPILDSSGAEYTSAVIGDLSISKNGGTLTALASAATLTHIANGQYTLALTTGNLDTLGRAQITCNKSTYQMPEVRLMVVPAMVFDSLILGSDRFDANVTHISDTAQTARDIGASVLLSSGTGTGQVKLASGYVAMTWADIGSPTTVVNLSGTTVKTATDVETDTADIQARLPAALVSGRIDSSVGAMAADTLTASALAASAVTEIQSGLATSTNVTDAQTAIIAQVDANETKIDSVLARLGAWTGSGINTILGAFRALAAKASSLTPTDLSTGTTFDNTTDSIEAIRDRGDAAWTTGSGGGSGSGARTVTVTVNDGTTVLQNATVRMTEGANTFTALTNASGVATFNLDDATYTVSITKSGYSYSGTTLVVDGAETVTYSMTQIAVAPPSDPSLCSVTFHARDQYGVDAVAEPVEITFVRWSDAATYTPPVVSIPPVQETDAGGLVEVELYRNATYKIVYGDAAYARRIDVDVPDAASFEVEI